MRDAAIEAALNEPLNMFIKWRQLDDGTYIALGRLMFTVALFVGVGAITPFKRRYCFSDATLAYAAYDDMTTGDDVPTGWIASRPETQEELDRKARPPEDN